MGSFGVNRRLDGAEINRRKNTEQRVKEGTKDRIAT